MQAPGANFMNKDLIFMVMLTNIGCAGGLLETRDDVTGANSHRSAVVGGPKQNPASCCVRS